MLREFRNAVVALQGASKSAVARGVNFSEETPKNVVYDYEASKNQYYKKSVIKYLDGVKTQASGLKKILTHGENPEHLPNILNIIEGMSLEHIKEMPDICTQILQQASKLTEPKAKRITKDIPNLPIEIKGELTADLREIDRAYHAGCFRSVTILCGRIIETTLHRKYYELTGQDILETNPGIGLGKLIAKLMDKGGAVDPALNNQIHLINQVRIHSVHKKQELFEPTEAQARAMVLYVTDVVERMFR